MTASDSTGEAGIGIAEAALLKRFAWTSLVAAVAVLVLLSGVAALYYLKTFNGLTDRSAMDAAQLARNIYDGRGFSTRFIRPFNVGFVSGDSTKVAELNVAPVYPYCLSAVFRLVAVSDQAVSWTSLGFHILMLLATFILGWLVFDHKVGLIAAAAVGLSAPLLESAVSGSQIPLVGLELTLLIACAALHHRAALADSRRAEVVYSLASGLLLALLFATDYVFAFALIPVGVYFWTAARKGRVGFVVFLSVAVVSMAPLAYRNAVHTGFPILGARAWDIMTHSSTYPGDTLTRSTDSALKSPLRPLLFPVEDFGAFAEKGARAVAACLSTLAVMLGPAVLPFAVVSTLYKFKAVTANALRGMVYGLAPLMLLVMGVYSEPPSYGQVFAPVAAVYASAYLVLLLEAKKIHRFFAQAFVAGVLAVTSVSAIAGLVWASSQGGGADQRTREVNNFYGKLGTRGFRYVVFTDVPWIAAWRTTGLGVWLPVADGDVYALEAIGLPMRVVILTPECENYSNDETWRMLHEVRLWRKYIQNPSEAEREILRLANIKVKDFPRAAKSLWRLRRQYRISATVSGFVTQPSDPLGPDYIQVLLHPDAVPRP